MPGRRDFGIMLSSALSDPRVRTAARFYVQKRLALKSTAVYAVLGHLSSLGLHLARETDDGIIRGPLSDALTVYLPGTPNLEAERIGEVLTDPSVGLLRPVVGGHYLAGFRDAYQPVVTARASARQRAAIARAAAQKAREDAAKAAGLPPEIDPAPTPAQGDETSSVSGATRITLPRCSGDEASMMGERSDDFEPADPNSSRDRSVTLQVSDPFRSVETKTPPPPEDGGRVSLRSPDGEDPAGGTDPPKPTRPLRPRARELLLRKLDYLAATGTETERHRAVELRKLHRASPPPTDERVRALLDSLRWITPERLRRHLADAKPRPRELK